MRLRRVALLVLLGALLVLVVAFTTLSIAYSPVYVVRWAVWQEADVGDKIRFPSSPIVAADEPFMFGSPSDPARSAASVRTAIERAGVVSDAEAFLQSTGTQALIVIRDDTILYEQYFGDFERDSIATSFSIAKSYLSALIGIAIDEGTIGGPDDPITDYLPELLERDARFGDISIRHLLNMSSGIHYVESPLPNGDDTLTYYFDDLRALALDHTTIDEPPGQHWQYVNYNPLLLGMILECATGEPVARLPVRSVVDAHWKRVRLVVEPRPRKWFREDGERHQRAGDRLRQARAALPGGRVVGWRADRARAVG
jgi:Beta-lactamase